jgi:hypothetical protein
MRSIRSYLADSGVVCLVARNGNEMTIKCDKAKFLASVAQYDAGAMVQTAFPYLNSTEREFMITGMSAEAQKAVFGD